MNLSLKPLVSLTAGMLMLVAPGLLNYIVAIHITVICVIRRFGGSFHPR